MQGVAHQNEIAKTILEYDISQVEYYESITNNMVGRVLRNHAIVAKDNKQYRLVDFPNLGEDEIEELIDLCDTKINDYLNQRGNKIFEHRRRNRKPVPGSIRYKVLRRAKYRCELCGISAEEKALEVDHIVPKNFGGEDSINNYQALCYTCNANKRDQDDTDFRLNSEIYEKRQDGCVFCEVEREVIMENNLALAFRDKYPVTEGHSLIIPRRHCKDYFDLHQAEVNAIHQLIRQLKVELENGDASIKGFNIGINNGKTAGQTILHCHFHLIPRRENDVVNPRGGVRHVIPGKGDY